jgi:hypothetical protein
MYMKMKLLRYLSVFALFSVIVACEDDDKITDNLPPEDANLYSFKPLTITNAIDENGNTFITSGTLNVDADISDEAPEGFSKQVLIQVIKIVDGVETEITRGAAYNLTGNGAGDVQTFNLNLDDFIDQRSEVNIAANILEAGTGRKIKGTGLLVKAETTEEDNQLDYKIKTIIWSDSIDRNGDGFFARRDVRFTVAVEGNVTEIIRGDVKLINDKTKDTTLILDIPQFEVKREGFSTNEISFVANQNGDWERAGYEFLFEFFDINSGEKVFEEFYKAADLVRIGFEPTAYDNRQYFLENAPTVNGFNQDSLGYFDSLEMSVDIKANNDLDYGNGLDFELEFPKVKVLYLRPFDPDVTEPVNIQITQLTADPFNTQVLNFDISELLPGDSATYDFIIQILEPADNTFKSTDDFVVAEYDKDDYPALGGVKINP